MFWPFAAYTRQASCILGVTISFAGDPPCEVDERTLLRLPTVTCRFSSCVCTTYAAGAVVGWWAGVARHCCELCRVLQPLGNRLGELHARDDCSAP